MTNEENNEELEEQTEPAPTGPGELLARKREELGLGLQQVADQLHITMHYVRALEENAHEKLPGEIFVRGYIRSYANLLKLDPDILINVYHEFASLQECAEQKAKNSTRRRRDKNLPWVIVSGVAFVAVAIALWYFNAEEAAPVTPARVTQSIEAAVGEIVREVGTPEQPQVSFSDHPETDEATTEAAQPEAVVSVVAEALATEQADVEDTSDSPVVDLSDTGPIEEAVASVLASRSAQEQVAEPILEQAVSEAPQVRSRGQVITVDAGGEDVLKITFSAESIVQIADSSDTQIYRDIRVAGDVLEVMGSAPFNVLLGDAASTSLIFNGSAVDFRTNIRVDNSARLTIGL